jgi:hypothetical protein
VDPLALLAVVHGIALAVRAGASGRVYRWAVCAVGAIGAGAFSVSFVSLRDLMLAIGYSPATAWAFPAIRFTRLVGRSGVSSVRGKHRGCCGAAGRDPDHQTGGRDQAVVCAPRTAARNQPACFPRWASACGLTIAKNSRRHLDRSYWSRRECHVCRPRDAQLRRRGLGHNGLMVGDLRPQSARGY